MRPAAAVDITVLGLDPSVNPTNFGWAAIRNGRLRMAGNMYVDDDGPVANSLTLIYTACRDLTLEQWYIEAQAANGIFYVAVDYPLMFTYRSVKNRSGEIIERAEKANLNDLARNHQAIGAALAALNVPDERTILYLSSEHRDVDKKLNRQRVISEYRLDPKKTPEHLTDAVKIAEDVCDKARGNPDQLLTLKKFKATKSTKELMR